MIEFNGYLSGAAEARFHRRSAILGQNILLACAVLLLPAIIRLGLRLGSWPLIGVYCLLVALIPLLTRIPKPAKERKAVTPKKIFVEDDYIVCVADKYTETKLVDDAKQLRDCGEYYEIVFPFGKISDKFVCQKSLLVKGTLEEFEALFEGKIKRI